MTPPRIPLGALAPAYAGAAFAAHPGDVLIHRHASKSCVILVPADQSLAEALAKYGVKFVTSCKQGVCGTCLTGLLDEEAGQRDAFLSDEEHQAGDKIMVCVSRAKAGRLVLDL